MAMRLVILGAGGFAREVADIVDSCVSAGLDVELLGFIVDTRYGSAGTIVNEKPILGDFEWFKDNRDAGLHVVCGVGTPHLRMQLVKRMEGMGIPFCNVIHPSAILTRWVSLGTGVVIAAGSIFTNRISLGNHVHVNLGCTVGHDCMLADYVTLAPGVHISGNVRLLTGCHIGTGSTVIEKLEIGEWSIVGAGSSIVRDVPPNSTVVGVPGKVIKTRETGWELVV